MESFAGCRGIIGRICETKFKNLKRRYMSLRTLRKQTGRPGPSKRPYYDLFDDLLYNDRAINPDNILEVGAGLNRFRRRQVMDAISSYILIDCIIFFLTMTER